MEEKNIMNNRKNEKVNKQLTFTSELSIMFSTRFVTTDNTRNVLSMFILDGGLGISHWWGRCRGIFSLCNCRRGMYTPHELVDPSISWGWDRMQREQWWRLFEVGDRRGRHDIRVAPHGGRGRRGHQCHLIQSKSAGQLIVYRLVSFRVRTCCPWLCKWVTSL